MSSDDLIRRVGVLESRVDRVCKFLSGMYWSSYLEEFDWLRQRVIDLEKNFKDSTGEMQGEIEGKIRSKVNKSEVKITEEVPIIADNFKDCERKKELAREVFSIDVKDNMAQIEVKDKNIEEVNEECLEGLAMIMKEYGNVSLSELLKTVKIWQY